MHSFQTQCNKTEPILKIILFIVSVYKYKNCRYDVIVVEEEKDSFWCTLSVLLKFNTL